MNSHDDRVGTRRSFAIFIGALFLFDFSGAPPAEVTQSPSLPPVGFLLGFGFPFIGIRAMIDRKTTRRSWTAPAVIFCCIATLQFMPAPEWSVKPTQEEQGQIINDIHSATTLNNGTLYDHINRLHGAPEDLIGTASSNHEPVGEPVADSLLGDG